MARIPKQLLNLTCFPIGFAVGFGVGFTVKPTAKPARKVTE